MFTGTKKELLYLMKQKGTLSVDEAADDTGFSKSALREHLFQLERDGYVLRDYVRSGPGRPNLKYELTQKGDDLFPSYESTLIRKLLKFMKERGDEKSIELFFASFWDERLDEVQRRMGEVSKDNMKSRLQELERMLAEDGFMPVFDFDTGKKSLNIRACNCPFGEVVKETRLPCKMEAMFYQKLFGGEVERKSYIADGDFSCMYDIPLKTG